MSEDNKVVAEVRENFGKGFARRLRAAGKIPAVIYGHGTEPQHVALPGHQVSLLIRRANALLDLDINGKSQLTLVKDVQKDPVRQIVEHIDLLVFKQPGRAAQGAVNGDRALVIGVGGSDGDAVKLGLEKGAIHGRKETPVGGKPPGARPGSPRMRFGLSGRSPFRSHAFQPSVLRPGART